MPLFHYAGSGKLEKRFIAWSDQDNANVGSRLDPLEGFPGFTSMSRPTAFPFNFVTDSVHKALFPFVNKHRSAIGR